MENIALLQQIISQRRTVKPNKYSAEKIEDATVQLLLEAANWAPTHGYTEPWRFAVFSQNGLKELGAFLAELDQPNTKAEDFNATRFNRLLNRPQQASHVIGIGMVSGTNPKIPEVEEVCAVAMAVQNMWLLADAIGLGAYWSTGRLAFRDETRAFMGLPAGAKSLGFFYLGKPAASRAKGRRLSTIDAKTTWRR
jgi:nitroreductase